MGIGMPRKSKSNERMVGSGEGEKDRACSSVALTPAEGGREAREERADQKRHEEPERRVR